MTNYCAICFRAPKNVAMKNNTNQRCSTACGAQGPIRGDGQQMEPTDQPEVVDSTWNLWIDQRWWTAHGVHQPTKEKEENFRASSTEEEPWTDDPNMEDSLWSH